jgi:hypothetical protein
MTPDAVQVMVMVEALPVIARRLLNGPGGAKLKNYTYLMPVAMVITSEYTKIFPFCHYGFQFHCSSAGAIRNGCWVVGKGNEVVNI